MSRYWVCAPCNEHRECIDDECPCAICAGLVEPTMLPAVPLFDRLTCLVLGHNVDLQLGGRIECQRCGKRV
jgi:hypothetical protein